MKSSDISFDTAKSIIETWAKALPSVNLHLGEEEDGAYPIEVGNLGFQPIEIWLSPERGTAQLEDSQATYKYEDGKELFTTAWDDQWTDKTPKEGLDFAAWLNTSVQKLIAGYIGWGPERMREPVESDEDIEYTLSIWLNELQELADSKFDVNLAPNQLQPYIPCASALTRVLEGDLKATQTLAKVLTSASADFEHIDSLASFTLRFITPELTEPNCIAFISATKSWLDGELKDIAKTKGDKDQTLKNLSAIVTTAGPTIEKHIRSILDLPAMGFPGPKLWSILLKDMNKHDDLMKDWSNFQPSCENPLKEGESFIKLEQRLNNNWREHLNSMPASNFDRVRMVITFNRRFRSSATDVVLCWMRVNRMFDRAVEIFTEQMQDIELSKLRYDSNPLQFEHMVGSAFGAFLDSQKEEHITLALELIETLEEHFEWTKGQCEYQLACIFARAGRLDEALGRVEIYVLNGGKSSYIKRDKDLAPIHDHPRFIKAIAAI